MAVSVLVTIVPGTANAANGTGPADLLNQLALLAGPYAATSAQIASLDDLEQQAISSTVTDHGLPDTDANAAATWGRPEAESELWGLIVSAVQTPAASRTADQQNAADWLTAVAKRQNILTADDAGLEYAKWAGLGATSYQNELAANPSETTLQTYLSATPLPYTGSGSSANPAGSTNGGYCVYRSPAPYQGEYTGNVYTPIAQSTADQTCFTACTSLLGCSPSTPSYDQFVRWGTADAESSLDSPGYAAVGNSVAEALALGGATVASVVSGVTLSSTLAGVLTGTSLAAALSPFGGVGSGAVAALGSEGLAEASAAVAATDVAGIVGIVIAAIAIGVIQGINVFSAAALPGQLAQLIAGATTTTPDVASMLASSTQASGLFALFIGATLPDPAPATCDNSQLQIPIASVSDPFPTVTPCLNAPAIPGPSSSDISFAVAEKGAATSTQSTTITWADAAQGTTNSMYAFGNWFAVTEKANSDGSSATFQALHIRYTDWNGKEQLAWLMGNASQGYSFVTAQDNPSVPVDPATCTTDGTCGSSQAIDYVGTDGKDYSATLPGGSGIPPVPPFSGIGVGSSTALTATTSSPAVGQPVTFTATISIGSLPSPGTVSFVSDLNGHDTTLCAAAPVTSVDDTPVDPGVIQFESYLNTATCTWTYTTPQAPVVYATYYPQAGSGIIASQGSLSVNVTNQAPTTTTPAAATASFSSAAQNVPLSATVSSASAVNEGTVTFTVTDAANASVGTATSGPVTNGAASASYALPAGLPAGAYTVKASYADTAGNFGPSSGSAPLTVNQAPSFTSGSAATFVTGTNGTFTVKAAGFPGGSGISLSHTGTLPSGVTFTDNHDGTATLAGTPAKGTKAGSYQITVTADNGVAPAAVQTFTLTVKNPVTVKVVPLPGTSVGRLPVLLTAILSAGDSRGTISFAESFDGGPAVAIPGCQDRTVFLNAALCLFTPGNLAGQGTYTVTASYSGDASYVSAAGSATVQEVAPTTLALKSSPASPRAGSALTVTATASPAPDGGSVSFQVTGPNGKKVTLPAGCTAAPAGTGPASCTFTPSAKGSYDITASYSGDALYLKSAATLKVKVS